MQIDKAAHAALRLKFTNNTLGIRATNGQARLLIEEGRKTQPKEMGLILKGVKLRQEGDRSLSLALAFLNNTSYEKCEEAPTTKPYVGAIARHLSLCLPSLSKDELRVALDAWLLGGRPKAILPSVPQEALLEEAFAS